ncbi:MAG: tetratricopeptide repeat protein [Planctomycetes bacterium]|nr:tetratricopeptide repeat protein [Planctomycetota bacterium]
MRRATELGTDGVCFAVLGDYLADLDRFEEAEAIFTQTLEDYPKCAMAWRDYGRALIRDRHPRGEQNLLQAAEAFERAAELEPERAENHYRLADALSCLHSGFLPRAKDHLERCLELRPDHQKARTALVELERLLREEDEEEAG